MPDYHIPLLPGDIYHVFNRAVGNEKLFRSEENYRFFLRKLEQYICPVAEIFTYSLMPNHFHLLVRIRAGSEIISLFETKKKRRYDPCVHSLSDFVMEQFSNCMNSYVKAFNKYHDRKGGLFMDYMKRARMKSDSDFSSFVRYIHRNAVHHGLRRRIGQWKFDGFQTLLSDKPTVLLREELFQWFGSRERFIRFHENL